MGDFEKAFERTLKNEGGYKLTDDPDDRGGMTYAGIARNRWPGWEGWPLVLERSDHPSLARLVREFYRENFWNRIHGDAILHQGIAEQIYDFAVNAGVATAVKLVQLIVGVTPDGAMGPKTLGALNEQVTLKISAADVFDERLAVAKLARYAAIADRDASQRQYVRGWLNRTLAGVG